MKSIIICSSISAAEEVLSVKDNLESRGFSVGIPYSIEQYANNGHRHISLEERTKSRKDLDLISRHYELLKANDVVLVVNPEKNGIPDYIGGNTFLEMGFAHVLRKPIYVLNQLPNCSYRDEIDAMNPIVLNGNLALIS